MRVAGTSAGATDDCLGHTRGYIFRLRVSKSVHGTLLTQRRRGKRRQLGNCPAEKAVDKNRQPQLQCARYPRMRLRDACLKRFSAPSTSE